MNSVEPPPRPGQEKWRTPRDGETLTASSARGSIPCPATHDSAHTLQPENDPTGNFLHQLSQILTSLRGTLELALLVDCDAQDYRRAIQQSLVQAEGLVQLFKSYRAESQGGNGESGESD
jgi:hypothetical protein